MTQGKPQGQQRITEYFRNVYHPVNGGPRAAWEAWRIETLYGFEKSAVVKETVVDPFIQLESRRLTACQAVLELAVLRALHGIGVWSGTCG